MTASTRPIRSTRLENLRLEGDRAWLDLDGEPIELAGEADAPALQSFQTFYQTAYRAYQTQPDRTPAGPHTPWWRRLRGRVTHWVGGMRAVVGRAFGPEASAGGAASPPVASSAAAVPPTVATPSAAPSALGTTRSTPQPAQSSRAASASTAPSPASSSATDPSPVPLLRAAFADEQGVHLIWKDPAGRGAKAEKELIYPFNSPVAAGLQACYGQLAEMGHAVVDLAAWQPAASAPEAEPRPEPEVGTAARGVEPASAPGGRAPPRPTAVPAAPKADQGRLMRLNPERSDIASRLVLIPAEGDPKPEVITGAETFFNALHAAADAAIPETERLTFLKCRQVKGELKVVELGFGRQAGTAAEPARTETAAAWWKNAQKIRAAEAKAPDAATPGALGTTRPTTEPAHQVELFGG